MNTMRLRLRRHVGLLLGLRPAAGRTPKVFQAVGVEAAARRAIPPEFTPHQYAILLLHIAAGVEHALMVQYLYAGFSLGGPQVPAKHRDEVARWQETILGIAKEEMGHLMTLQNLLRCLGGPLSLDREDYPWDSELYPFPFQLEPLTRQSLAKYVVAESPEPSQWTGKEAGDIRALAQKGVGGAHLHRVGELYALLERLLADEEALKDSDFRDSTYPFQATWDEWGRGYQGGARGSSRGAAMAGTPDVILRPITGRTDALDAIRAVVTQGEANPSASVKEPSHFARFLLIFRKLQKIQSWSPSRNVPVNPVVTNSAVDDSGQKARTGTPIGHPEGQLWGHLFNIRYQLLLTNLLRTFDYPTSLSESGPKSPRGLLLHSTFGEMYNLRVLSQILMQTPLSQAKDNRMAGPPFQMPFTLSLPVDSVDRWHLHRDLLQASQHLGARLLIMNPGAHSEYLLALKEADQRTVSLIDTIQAGSQLSVAAHA